MTSVPTPDVSLDEPEDEIVWDDAPSPAPPPPTQTPQKPRGRVDAIEDLAAAEIEKAVTVPAKPATPARPKAKPQPLKSPEPLAAPVEARERVGVLEVLGARRKTVILVGLGLLVLGTSLFRSWRSWVEDLPRVAELGKTEGIPALDEGKFQLAHQILSKAKRAVVTLGDAFEGASAIKRAADEAAVFADFDPARLEEMLDEASRVDPDNWEKTFATYYKNRYVLIDSQVKSVPDARGSGSYELHYRVLPDGGDGERPPSSGRIDLKGFRLFEVIPPKKDERVIFGAKVVSFVFDKSKEEWVIGLDPESGVTITHEKALQKIGWPDATVATGEDGR